MKVSVKKRSKIFERTVECYETRMHLGKELCKYSKYKLALLNVRLTVAAAAQDAGFKAKLPDHGRILMSTLNSHLDQMTRNSDMNEVYLKIGKHYAMEAERIIAVYHNFIDIEAPDFFSGVK